MNKAPVEDKSRRVVVVEPSWPQPRTLLRIILAIVISLITLWIIARLTGVILLLVLSIFFAYLVAPMVDFLRRPIKISGRQVVMPRVLAISLAYVLIIGVLVIALSFAVPRLGNQFPEFAEQARGYWRTIGEKAESLTDYYRLHRLPEPVLSGLYKLTGSVEPYISALVSSLLHLIAYVPWLVLIPILSFFLLKDADTFRRSALQMLPRGRWRWRGDEFFQDVSGTLAAYTRAQLTACLFIGVVCTLGFTLLGLPSPLVLGFLAGVFEFVPLIGPLLIAIIAAVVGGFHGGLFSSFLVLLFLGVLRIIHDYFIYPRLIGQGIHLHPLAVIIAILSGHELAGVAGIFLAIPVVAIVTVSYRHWLEHRGSEGFADLIDPTANDEPLPGSENYVFVENEEVQTHPRASTTARDMARARPDLTTGELKMPE